MPPPHNNPKPSPTYLLPTPNLPYINPTSILCELQATLYQTQVHTRLISTLDLPHINCSSVQGLAWFTALGSFLASQGLPRSQSQSQRRTSRLHQRPFHVGSPRFGGFGNGKWDRPLLFLSFCPRRRWATVGIVLGR